VTREFRGMFRAGEERRALGQTTPEHNPQALSGREDNEATGREVPRQHYPPTVWERYGMCGDPPRQSGERHPGR
jgi:hypothetical protein